MKISRKWLDNYIKSDKSDNELSDLFTQLGLECNVETNKNNLSDGIIVGKIISCKKHPNADRLKLCLVDIAQKEPLEIICGAPNVSENIKVSVATSGTSIGDIKIKKTKIRGITSNGMICSEKELGIGNNHDGIMILDSKYKIGEKLNNIFTDNSDTIFDFDMTPNRGDCFSHLGIARELSIIENKEINLKIPKIHVSNFSTSELINVNIKESDICDRYACRIIKNIRVKESPSWLKERLESIGQNSINNIVDIANFIMFDLGQPLHVFDLDKINSNKIEVRLAKNNEKIISLDSEKKILSNNDIVISDSKGPIAIAGVIGGLNSHVDENTKNILVESAIFNPINIRKTAKEYEYSKEASKRFERGIDYDNVIFSMNKFVSMLQDISDCKIATDYIDINQNKYLNSKILFDIDKCNKFLGTNIKVKEIKNIFRKLSIKVETNGSKYDCIVPAYRNDLERDVDLYEEIARVYGYDNIPSNLIFNFPSNCFVKDENLTEDNIRLILSSNGFNEHYSNSLYSKDNVSLSSKKPIKIKNPLSQDMEFLRNSLVPGMLKALLFNEKRENTFLKFFEIGSVNELAKKVYNSSIERRMLCVAYLVTESTSWKNKVPFDIYDVKGDITMLLNNLGFTSIDYKVKSDTISINVNNNSIGTIYNLKNDIKNKFKFDNNVIVSEIYLDDIVSNLKNRKLKYTPVIPFPSVKRDLAILVSNNIKHEQIVENIFQSASNILKEVKLFDVYVDNSLGDKSKSLAYSLKFQSNERTLKIEDVDKEINLILKKLKNNLNAVQR